MEICHRRAIGRVASTKLRSALMAISKRQFRTQSIKLIDSRSGKTLNEMKRFLPFVIIAAALGAGLFMFLYFQRSTAETPSATSAPSPAQKAANTSSQAEPGAEPPHLQGSQNAPVTLEEF